MLNSVETSYKLWFTHDDMEESVVSDLTLTPARNTEPLMIRIRYSDAPDHDERYALVRFPGTSWLINFNRKTTTFISDPADRNRTAIELEGTDLEDTEIEELAAALNLAVTHTDYGKLEDLESYTDIEDLPF